MSTTQKLSIKGLKIGKDQYDLLVSTVKGLVGEAGTVTAKEKLSDSGLRIRSRHAVAQNAQFADIKIRFHGSNADVGIYVDADGQIGMAWDGYVVRGNAQLKNSFEGRGDRHTFEKNLNARFVMETLEKPLSVRALRPRILPVFLTKRKRRDILRWSLTQAALE